MPARLSQQEKDRIDLFWCSACVLAALVVLVSVSNAVVLFGVLATLIVTERHLLRCARRLRRRG